MNTRTLLVVLTILTTAAAATWPPTGDRSYGLVKSEKTGGPRVIYDVLAKPLPEILLPNDQATRIDITSATSRRINVSPNAATEYERRARAEFNRMDGFGTFAPISSPLMPSSISKIYKSDTETMIFETMRSTCLM